MTAERNKSVPELRFPGFVEEWETSLMRSLATVKHGYAFKGEHFTDSGDYIVLTPGNFELGGGFRYQGEKEKFYGDPDFPKDYILRRGDLITAMTEQAIGLIGSPLIVPDDGKFLHNQRLGLFQFSEGKEPRFLYFAMQTNTMRVAFSNTAAGSKVRHTSPKRIEALTLNLPTLPEQQKIADFLTAVDGRIGQLIQKKALLEDCKKGVMQQLFTQAIRFKDDHGNDFPEWEEKKLGEICHITMGQSPDSRSYNEVGNGLPLIQGNADIKNRKSCPRIWTSEPTKVCVVGDLLLTVRAPVGAVAKSEHNACLGRGVASIKNKPTATQSFIYQWLLEFEPRWIRIEQGSTFTAVSGTDIRGLAINVPSIPEQTKIAEFLTALDRKIESVGTQITATQTFKRGLLQQMFV